MKRIICFLSLLLIPLLSYAAKDQEITPEQCRAASVEIIKVSEQALPMAEDKKNAAKLSKFLEEWKKRLDSDEDACDIYQDILKSSSRF